MCFICVLYVSGAFCVALCLLKLWIVCMAVHVSYIILTYIECCVWFFFFFLILNFSFSRSILCSVLNTFSRPLCRTLFVAALCIYAKRKQMRRKKKIRNANTIRRKSCVCNGRQRQCTVSSGRNTRMEWFCMCRSVTETKISSFHKTRWSCNFIDWINRFSFPLQIKWLTFHLKTMCSAMNVWRKSFFFFRSLFHFNF